METNDSYLENVYNYIAKDFNTSRYKVWKTVANFLESLPKNSKVLEVGCGNGKNMLYRNDLKFTGIDFSQEMINICKNKKLTVYKANMLELPFLNRSFDVVISVASLHHLDSFEKRQLAIKEMLRVLDFNGLVFIQVWALDKKFNTSDQLIPFKPRDNKSEIMYRYYHFYKQYELEKEILSLKQKLHITHQFYEKGNWGIIARKLIL